LAEPVWTPKAPRRGDERTEADEVGRQAKLRSSDEAAKLPSNRGINHRQTHAVRPQGEGRRPESIFSPRPVFLFPDQFLTVPSGRPLSFCGSFAGVFSGPTFTPLKDVKQLIQVSKPLPEYDTRRANHCLHHREFPSLVTIRGIESYGLWCHTKE
jgi:hypothetical protein